MAKIEVISRSIIQPKTTIQESVKNKKIELTSNDVRFLLVGPIQKGLLFSKPQNTEIQELHQKLQFSLSCTLDFFFPLAGRFGTVHNDDDTMSFFIDCNNAGVQYVSAEAQNVTVSDILDPAYFPPFLQSFFPLNGSKNYQATSIPLLAVQVTQLTDGFFIGCTVNHAVTDGTTFWNFINSWSEICRSSSDLQILKTPPVFENWFRGGSNCPISLPVSIFKTDFEFTPPPLHERIFHFSKEKIQDLKAKANSVAGSEKIKISSLQSLLAHLWRSLILAGKIDPEGDTIFRFIVGLRSRLKPEIPEEFFGNAIQFATVAMKIKELEEQGFEQVALAINRVVVSFTEEEVRKNLEESIKKPEIISLSGFVKNALIMTSSPRFNIYGNDFGWGKPMAVRSGASNKFDGMLTLYPGVEEGSLDVEVCASPHVLQAIVRDSEFMDSVGC